MTDAKFDFEDLIQEIVHEGDSSNAALLRWQQHYPKFRDRIAEFFATWKVQKLYEDLDVPEPDVDEDALVHKGVAYAMDILRRQGRLLPETPAELPEPFEQLMMTAVYLLQLHGVV